MTRGLSVTPLLVLAACLAVAQEHRPSNGLTILLPPGVPSETVNITYALEDSFGSHGAQVRAKPNRTAYSLLFEVGMTEAARIRAVIWAPGCAVSTYDIAIPGPHPRPIAYQCVLLPATTLTGQIRSVSLISGRPYELAISYSASWQCQFFGWFDCMVPQLPIATVAPAADGTFRVELPDFSRDPVIAKFKDPNGRIGNFQLLLRDPETLNHIAELKPEADDLSVPGGGLKALSAYPPDIVFKTVKAR
jgi:hypothetical protein